MTFPHSSSVADSDSFHGTHHFYPKSTAYATPRANPPVKLESLDPPLLPHPPPFRFGALSQSSSIYPFMSGSQWPQSPPLSTAREHPAGDSFSLRRNPTQSSPTSILDYEDGDDLGDLPLISGSATVSSGKSTERQVRRRSSKACDQCRKLKCKCERTSDGSQCRNCLMLNAKCTFLGPSRKRGPPKGYIDAIEVRLHQTEALIGILLAMAAGADDSDSDPRAQSLIEDLSQDTLAREIIDRVDNSAYGFKGRQRSGDSNAQKGHTREQQSSESEKGALHSTHPSHKWQDDVISKIRARVESLRVTTRSSFVNKSLPVSTELLSSGEVVGTSLARVRRKISAVPDISSPSSPSRSPLPSPFPSSRPVLPSGLSLETPDLDEDGGEREGLEDSVGQLSLNEDEQVRFHGKASGLHLLDVKMRIDGRNEGGIWKFPKARVWPPLPGSREYSKIDEDFVITMPDQAMQEHLIELYWAHVHPALPILHKQSFVESFKQSVRFMNPDSPYSGSQTSSSSQSSRGSGHIPTVLLLAIFSLAARYSKTSAPLPPEGEMWPAGDAYLDSAKTILESSYSTPRVGTCQALLLLGYREIGIGSMAQAWVYIGMAVRMAQDLGMHRTADRWQRVGTRMFSSGELQERRRIWYACVVMDKYVSTYIGRPIAIFERDFDTDLPSEQEMEESEKIPTPASHGSEGPISRDLSSSCISCFNASARLSIILSRIVQVIYAIRPDASRTGQLKQLGESLDKWYLDLPEHLRFDPAMKSATPPPHVLTLHMQYWCSVILLYRPFIRHLPSLEASSPKEVEIYSASQKYHDMCVQAANKITAIVGSYYSNYSVRQSSVFLCYYVFTASITHVSNLSLYPDDPQARVGLNQCMNTLKEMELLWPSAGRAWELLNGTQVILSDRTVPIASHIGDRRKRSADEMFDDDDAMDSRRHETSLDHSAIDMQQNYPPVASSPGPLQGSSQPYYSTYAKAWPGTPGYANNPMNSLSTSVLPQQYSTGFADARNIPATGMRSSSSSLQDSRYFQQYWSDYSTLGQLDPVYGIPMIPDSNQQQHPSIVAQNQASMYISYPLFNAAVDRNQLY